MRSVIDSALGCLEFKMKLVPLFLAQSVLSTVINIDTLENPLKKLNVESLNFNEWKPDLPESPEHYKVSGLTVTFTD